jgi:hypothetical protein
MTVRLRQAESHDAAALANGASMRTAATAARATSEVPNYLVKPL